MCDFGSVSDADSETGFEKSDDAGAGTDLDRDNKENLTRQTPSHGPLPIHRTLSKRCMDM